MSHSVIISYNSANPKEYAFVKKLLDYLGTKNIDAVLYDPNYSETGMRQWLLNAQWLVLVLTPEAIKSPRVQLLVNTVFDHVKLGHMQGILALAFLSNPVEPEDMPYPTWSTIRTYYTGESDEDHQQAFEKLSRTLGYTRVPVAVSSPADNWASSFSRPLSAISQPVRRSYRHPVRYALPLALIVIILLSFSGVYLISKHQTTPKPNVKATMAAENALNATALAKAAATSHARASATAYANATSTVIADALRIYQQDVVPNKFSITMSANDPMQEWDQTNCMFVDVGMYQVTTTGASQYKACMAKKTSYKNFAYQGQMKINSGNAGGLIFRSDGAGQFYGFSLDSKGNYALFVCQPSTCSGTTIDSGKQLAAHNFPSFGQTNTLTVIAKDQTIYLYINKKFVDKVNSSTIIHEGEIGVFAASEGQSTGTTQVTFSNVQVWNLA